MLDTRIAVYLLFAALIAWGVMKSRKSSEYRFPSQVPGLPVFGNTFQIPKTQQGPWAKDLAEKHGEM